MAKKKKSIWEEYKKEFAKSRKRSRKATYKLMNVDSKIKKNIYKSLTKGPKNMERIIGFVFLIFVFVIFHFFVAFIVVIFVGNIGFIYVK